MADNKIAEIPPPPAASAPARAKSKGFINPLLADVIGGVSSLVAGGMTAWRITQERAYKNISSLYFFEDIKDHRRALGTKLVEEVEKGTITPELARLKLEEVIHEGERLADQRLKKAGSYDVLKQFGLLRSHQKWEVAISAIAVGGISLGSVLLLTRGIFSEKEQQALAGEQNTPPPR